jgi:methylated-DNA-[protein]-cysteine S-methyltransferase
MAAHHFALFDSSIGRCAIAWGADGVARVQLPEAREAATRARLLRQLPDAREAPPPPAIRRAIEDIVALLGGEARDLASVALDMAGLAPFQRRVYEAARRIPAGATRSYGEIATQLGAPGAARAVGQALGRNPFAIVVPCHRVVSAGGRVGGFSANGGIATKLRMLAIEASANGQPGIWDGDAGFAFDPKAALRRLRGSDAALARVIDAVGAFRMELKPTTSLFAALAESIVYQQLSGRAARTIYARVCALFPRAHEGPTPRRLLRLSDERLRAAGLSRSKLLSLRDLARRAEAGGIPTLAEARTMDDDALVARLVEVRGIGRWTVEMLLMLRLGRPDVLPVDDYGIRKGFARAFGRRALPGRGELEARGARWKPYRTVASWYLWRVLELESRP